MDSLAFLERAPRGTPRPIYVLHGDEDFLKRQVLSALKQWVLGEGDDAFGLSTHAGDRAEFAAVRDDLETLPFLSPRRLVVVENADSFVTRHRPLLEKYVGQPAGQGVLVLEVKSWPGNTRLAKLIDEAATLTCKSPAAFRLPAWCGKWAAARHDKKLDPAAAQLLVDLVGADMGQLDQELAKLAIYVGDVAQIGPDDVDQLVGRSRGADTFKIFDAIGAGRRAEAFAILDRLFDQGEEPLAILGAFSWQLRRLAQVSRRIRQGAPAAAAMDQAGVPPFARQGIEQQLRHLGLRRAGRLYDWLLEVDFGLKGGSPLPPRLQLERLLLQLARPREES